jgi:hypothetical protein
MTEDGAVLSLPSLPQATALHLGKGKADIVTAGTDITEVIGYSFPFGKYRPQHLRPSR